MALVQKIATQFFEEDDGQPGLFQKLDGSVWLRSPNGAVAQLSGGGGGSSYVAVPVVFNTAGLLAGLPLFTLVAGQLLLDLKLSITTAFNGTAPRFHFGVAGDVDAISTQDVNSADFVITGNLAQVVFDFTSAAQAALVAVGGSETIQVLLDNSSGGDPHSTVGAGTVYYLLSS